VLKRNLTTNTFNPTSIYAENSRKSSSNTDEVTAYKEIQLVLGFKNKVKRDSRDKDVNEPILMVKSFFGKYLTKQI
jgi:hypothetical protein